MNYSFIKQWVEDDIAVIQLNRPNANAITFEFACELEAAFKATISRKPRAIITTGSGTFFSGGLDLKAVPLYSTEQQADFLQVINRVITGFYACEIPVIGAINGHAIAAGFMFALTADYRIGPTNDALFGLTEARAGIPFPAAPMEILKAELAPADIRFTALSALTFDSQAAQNKGVFDELVANAQVLHRAFEVARDFASMPADAYTRIKTQVRGATISKLQQLNQKASDPMLRQWLSPKAEIASTAILNDH